MFRTLRENYDKQFTSNTVPVALITWDGTTWVETHTGAFENLDTNPLTGAWRYAMRFEDGHGNFIYDTSSDLNAGDKKVVPLSSNGNYSNIISPPIPTPMATISSSSSIMDMKVGGIPVVYVGGALGLVILLKLLRRH
jgi:hypothetical protein